MLYIQYLILVISIIFISIALSNCMDKIDQRTNLGGAFLGGILLAVVTSLPELFTSLTALFQLDKPQIVQGNVVGSNLFNIAIIACMSILFINVFKSYKYKKSQIFAFILCILQCLLILFALFIKISFSISGISIHIVSICIFICYLIGIHTFQEVDIDDNTTSDTSVFLLFIQFIIFAIALVYISIQLTKISDLVAISLGFNATLAGAIFLGVATSLPEFSATFTLFKLRNIDAAIASLIGSCMFNFLILSISDFLYIKEVVYSYDYQTFIFLIFTLASLIYAILLLKYSYHTLYILLFSVFLLSCYTQIGRAHV